jgi:hypothetical protein
MIASSCSRSIRNPYFSDFWETMTRIMNKSLALLQWVRLGKARGEHNESGVPPKAEVVGTLSYFRVGPIPEVSSQVLFRSTQSPHQSSRIAASPVAQIVRDLGRRALAGAPT